MVDGNLAMASRYTEDDGEKYAPFNLTRENYHSTEARQHYMTNSQFNDYLDCEARAMAQMSGEYLPEATTAMKVGSYFDAWVQGTLKEFRNDPANSDIFTQKGKLRSEYVIADKMIDAVRIDTNAMIVLKGRKQAIFTAEFSGANWSVMLDVFNDDNYAYVDTKTTKSIWQTEWNSELRCRQSFVEAYNYPRQMAICCEIVRRALNQDAWPEALILAVSKEDPPDKILLDMRDNDRFFYELNYIESHMPRIIALREGRAEPVRCEHCAYCRKTKKIARAYHYRMLDPEN